MRKVNDGGPAFACRWTEKDRNGEFAEIHWRGMSMRDYFAAAALQGLLSKGVEYQKDAEEFVSNIAPACYQFADRMLSEREKHNVD